MGKPDVYNFHISALGKIIQQSSSEIKFGTLRFGSELLLPLKMLAGSLGFITLAC